MKRSIPVAAAAALLLAFAGASEATFENHAWNLAGAEKIAVTRLGKDVAVATDVSFQIDGSGNFSLFHPDAGTFTGTVEDAGKFTFRTTPSAQSLSDFEDFVVGLGVDVFGLSNVVVESFTAKVSGKVKKSDESLKLKISGVVKGTAFIKGKQRKGKLAYRAILLGPVTE